MTCISIVAAIDAIELMRQEIKINAFKMFWVLGYYFSMYNNVFVKLNNFSKCPNQNRKCCKVNALRIYFNLLFQDVILLNPQFKNISPHKSSSK